MSQDFEEDFGPYRMPPLREHNRAMSNTHESQKTATDHTTEALEIGAGAGPSAEAESGAESAERGEKLSDERIVVGVDGSPSSIAALRRGNRIAEALKVPLQVVSAWTFPSAAMGYFPDGFAPAQDAKDELEAAIALALPAERSMELIETVMEGGAAEVLIAESEGAGMLIVGSRGRGAVAGLLLGSVSAACAQHASCPVLIMHDATAEDTAKDSATANAAENAAAVSIAAR